MSEVFEKEMTSEKFLDELSDLGKRIEVLQQTYKKLLSEGKH